MVLFVGIIGVFGLSSCTKSFVTNQDKANQYYAYYGNLYATSVDLENNSEDNVTLQNKNRETLFSKLNEANGYASIDKTFLNYMNDKVNTFVDQNYTLWTDNTLGKIEDVNTAKKVCRSVAIYAGIETDSKTGNKKVSEAFKNFDTWYDEAVNDAAVGVLHCPSASYVTTMKSTMSTTINSVRAGFSPDSQTFTQNGAPIYIEGKTWGQAFSEYGFLEGLLVYPFAWIVHKISSIDLSNGWMQILAILVVTLIARLITVFSTLLQTRTQAKQQRIQPLLNQLQKKYPDQTDPDQRKALAMEQSQLMRQNKVHPFLPMLLMIIQFPIFICVWAALQDSAALAAGNWLGLSLTTTVSQCMTNYSNTPGALTGIFIFIVMTVSNVLASATSLFFNSWRTKNFGTTAQQIGPDGKPMDPNKTMKWMTIIMSIFIIYMGFNLPAGMGIYWLLGSIISIAQTIIMEMVQTKHRHDFAKNTGDGSTLAAVRRSKHHTATGKKVGSNNKSDKPLWR
jgi:YidC/Oxa1 family membrane protein insertase